MELINKIRTYSIPLIAGVIVALIAANLFPETYHHLIHAPIIGEINFHFLVNDIFMVFFFGTAGVEIVHSLSKGGALNPIQKAVAPLMATAGGILGPIAVFFILNMIIGDPSYANGWGICTATDIALAWLFAKLIFGADHPAVKFLLLLAVADDAIGLIIIAVFYPSPDKAFLPMWLLLIPAGMLVAFILRKMNVRNFWAYVLLGGTLAWFGLHNAGLHAALALVFIVPFMPKADHSEGHEEHHDAPELALDGFERIITPIVDFGLFFFGFSAAGVEFSNVSALSFTVMLAVIIGKTVGISLFTWVTTKFKVSLPEGMTMKDVIVAGFVGGIGLTVALFVCESAFTDASLVSAAKMGALFTVISAVPAFIVAKILGIKKVQN